jgi:dCMP deaminase
MSKESDNKYRPSWDDYFMALVRILATRGSCDRLHTAAILVKNKRVISSGYNGAPPGMPTCDQIGHLLEEGHCVRTIHGEHNAILQAAQMGGISTVGSTMYAKYNPCIHCAKYVIAAGIQRVVIGKLYRGDAAVKYLRDAKVLVDFYENNDTWNKHVSNLFLEEVEEMKPKEGDVKLSADKYV